VLILLALALTAGFTLTRPAVLRRLLEPALGRAFGGDVHLERVSVHGLTEIRVGSMTLTSPGWEGPAAEVVRAEDLHITLSRSDLFSGQVRVDSLSFGRLRIRAAERDEAPGVFNVLDLRPDVAGGDEPLRVRRIDLARLELEMGTVARDGTWSKSGSRAFSGFLSPDPSSADARNRKEGTLFAFQLQDLARGGPVLTGTWDDSTFAFTVVLAALTLDSEILDALPLAIRPAAKALKLGGEVRGASIRWAPDAPLTADVAVVDMRLTLPDLNLGDRWSRFRDGKREPRKGLPTMHIREGRMRFDGTRVTFERLVGEIASSAEDPGLVPVPVEVNLRLDLGPESLKSIDWRDAAARKQWFDDLLLTAPFKFDVAIRGFDSEDSAPGHLPILEVPTPVAAALEVFGFTAWKLDVEAEFSRGLPHRDERGLLVSSPILSRGQCFLSNARGAYEEFPYPISGVKGHLSFDLTEGGLDRITVDYITGTTASGCDVNISGNVVSPGKSAGVDIAVRATALPLNDQLIDCFNGDMRAALAMLVHRPSYERLVAAKLIPDDQTDELRQQMRALDAEMRRISDEAARTAMGLELARRARMLQTQPFVLGGTAAIDLRLERPLGPDQEIIGTGTVTVDRAGLVVQHFPYPVVVTGGKLLVLRDEIVLADGGLRAVTLDGGVVRIAGRLVVERAVVNGRHTSVVRPEISLTGAGDHVSPRLFAAIPPSRDTSHEGWPGGTLAPSARLLAAARVQGELDFHGEIRGDPAQPGPPQLTLNVEVSHGSIDAEQAEGVGLAIPRGLQLRDLRASLRIAEDRVEIRSLEALALDGIGSITASGHYDGDGSKSVDVTLHDMSIAPWLAEAFPTAARAGARAWWNHLRPEGMFDASMKLVASSSGALQAEIVAQPRAVTVAPDGQRIACRGDGGDLRITANDGTGEAVARGLRLILMDPDDSAGEHGTHGSITLDGGLQFGPEGVRSLELRARAEDMEFASPLIPALMGEADESAFAATYESVRPVGRFDGTLTFASIGASKPTWNLECAPKSLSVDIGSTRPSALFSTTSRFTATPKSLRCTELEAQFATGRILCDASIDFGASPRIGTASFELQATQLTEELAALLPPPLNTARETIELSATRFSLDDAHLSVQWTAEGTMLKPLLYSFDTKLTVTGASFHAGLPITECDSTATMSFRYDGAGAEPVAHLDVTLDADRLRIHDRELVDGTASLALDHGGRLFVARSFEGTLAGGRLAGNASFDIATRHYAADVRVSGAELGPLMYPRDANPPTTGVVDGRLTVDGNLDDLASRRGRGRVSVRDGIMASSPETLRLLQISQLMLPLSSALKSADIAFFLEGPIATFDRFVLAADGLDLDGRGTVDTRDFSIDAAFTSRGRLAVISDVLGAVSNQLYEIELRGPLNDPVARLRPLPGLIRSSNRTRTIPPSERPTPAISRAADE